MAIPRTSCLALEKEEGVLPRPAPYIQDGARNLLAAAEVD